MTALHPHASMSLPQDRTRPTGPLQSLWLDFRLNFSSGPICAPNALARCLLAPPESHSNQLRD
jgi:hypothetical protein